MPGEPIPKGSMVAHHQRNPKTGQLIMNPRNGEPLIIQRPSSARLKPWMKTVARAALKAKADARWQMAEKGTAVLVTARFFFERPKAHYRTGRFAAVLREDAPRHHSAPADVDKLVRACLDEMTGVLYEDDGQVCQGTARKYWSPRGQGSRAEIALTIIT